MTLNCDTIADAAKYVLKNARGGPLSIEKITESINQQKIYLKNPNLNPSSVRSMLSHHDDFESVGNGDYKLKKYDHLIETELRPKWKHSNVQIAITEDLRKQIDNENDESLFCERINIVERLARKYYSYHFKNDNSDIFPSRKLKLIIGTKEEVNKRRKQIKRLNGDNHKSEIIKLQLKIVNQVSKDKVCNDIVQIQESIDELTEMCIKYQTRDRYAFYRPRKCEKEIHIYPVLQDSLDYIPFPFMSDYIMMPYDIDESSKLTFTPNFYQAFYHELYHFRIYDEYRGNEVINEGMPEVYSELCYDQFMKKVVESNLDQAQTKHFFTEYMKFRDSGGYKTYYDSIKKKIEPIFTQHLYDNFQQPYDNFCELICHLIELANNMTTEHLNTEDKLLPCDEKTPLWGWVFDAALYM